MESETLGDRVRRRREELGYTQKQLAKLVGYKSQSGIGALELGKHASSTKLAKLAIALRMTVDELQFGEVKPLTVRQPAARYQTDLAAIEQRMLAAFRMLTGSQQEAKVAEIEAMARANAELIKELGHNKSNGTDG